MKQSRYLSHYTDKLAGRFPGHKGHPTVLTAEEETKMVDHCIAMANIGYPMTCQDLCNDVGRLLSIDGRSTPFKDGKPGIYCEGQHCGHQCIDLTTVVYFCINIYWYRNVPIIHNGCDNLLIQYH